jgi:hypothetical protein
MTKLKRAMVKILTNNLATEQNVSTTNFLLQCLSKFCTLEGLICWETQIHLTYKSQQQHHSSLEVIHTY